MLLSMQEGIIYGPVNSRRLGRSLGINLSPGKNKLCSFNCRYCHYGWTKRLVDDFTPYADELPGVDEVISALTEAVKARHDFEFITFSGNGEPTLHPGFPAMVSEVVKIRGRLCPHVKVALLSNSTGLMRAEVREIINFIDMPIFKLDAGTVSVFQAINRPAAGIDFEIIVAQMACLNQPFVQTVFVDGDPGNTGEAELDVWYQRIGKINPRQVHIYSIDRPVPDRSLRLVSPERLETIAASGKRLTGVDIRAFYPSR